MSWKSRYQEQAAVAREAENHCKQLGDAARALHFKRIAECYEQLARENDESPQEHPCS